MIEKEMVFIQILIFELQLRFKSSSCCEYIVIIDDSVLIYTTSQSLG